MHPTAGADNPVHIFLALWRQNDEDCCIEFFVPLEGYTKFLRPLLTASVVQTARRAVGTHFGLEPRGNARIFRLEDGCVVAFGLTGAEARGLSVAGGWLPAGLIEDPLIKSLLTSVAERL